MTDTHSIEAYDAHGNRYRLTVYREMIGSSPRGTSPHDGVASSTLSIPIDIIGPRGEWVTLVGAGRFSLQPLEKDQAAIELFSDEPIAP